MAARSNRQPSWVTMAACGHRAQTSQPSHQSRWDRCQAGSRARQQRLPQLAVMLERKGVHHQRPLPLPAAALACQAPLCPHILPSCALFAAAGAQVEAIMKGFASIEANGHAGELGSTGIRMGEDKFQVSGEVNRLLCVTGCRGRWHRLETGVRRQGRAVGCRRGVVAVWEEQAAGGSWQGRAGRVATARAPKSTSMWHTTHILVLQGCQKDCEQLQPITCGCQVSGPCGALTVCALQPPDTSHTHAQYAAPVSRDTLRGVSFAALPVRQQLCVGAGCRCQHFAHAVFRHLPACCRLLPETRPSCAASRWAGAAASRRPTQLWWLAFTSPRYSPATSTWWWRTLVTTWRDSSTEKVVAAAS